MKRLSSIGALFRRGRRRRGQRGSSSADAWGRIESPLGIEAAVPDQARGDDDSVRILEAIRDARHVARDLPDSFCGSDHVDDNLGDFADLLPTYEMLGRIEGGGQGRVYRVKQRSTGQILAMKLLLGGPLASRSQRQRFKREVDLLSRLDHTNIVRLYDSGLVQGCPFFVMELVDGLPIDDYALLNDLTVRQVLELFVATCQAIVFAHQRGVLHRDLKPSNILVDQDGRPRLLDFGLGKDINGEIDGMTAVSEAGQVAGTPPYFSPEQAGGQNKPLDVRTDVYSIGIVLYELLTGGFPYPVDGTVDQVRRNVRETEPMRLRDAVDSVGFFPPARRAEIGPDLECVVRKALEKDPERRYPSVEALMRDLERYLAGEAVEARSPSGFYVLRRMLVRHRRAAAVIALLMLLVGGSTGAITMQVLERRKAEASGAVRLQSEREFNRNVFKLYEDVRSRALRLDEVKELPVELREQHLARYRAERIEWSEALPPLGDEPWTEIWSVLDGRIPPGQLPLAWIERVEPGLDALGQTLASRAVHIPLGCNQDTLSHRSFMPLAQACSRAATLAFRIDRRQGAGNHTGAVTDLETMRFLAMDCGDGLEGTGRSLGIRNLAYKLVQRALSDPSLESTAVRAYCDWINRDAPHPDVRADRAFQEAAFVESLSYAFETDYAGEVHLDLNRLDKLAAGSLAKLDLMTPAHKRFAASIRPDNVAEHVHSYIGIINEWHGLTLPEILPRRESYVRRRSAAAEYDATLSFLGFDAKEPENSLRRKAIRRTLLIAAGAWCYRETRGIWPDDPATVLCESRQHLTTDPLTGSPFEVDYPDDRPRIRSAALSQFDLEQEDWLGGSGGAIWIADDEDRLTYFPAEPSEPHRGN